MKVSIIIGICMLFLVMGCTKVEYICCDNNYPTPYNKYVVCDNQAIWDNRGSIKDFKCECDNVGCKNFPTIRTCTAKVWAYTDNGLEFVEEKITCTETIGKDRRFS